ncbi:MAG: phenylalanine--tRNA ligase subunit beta [Actinomycetota bacterium]
MKIPVGWLREFCPTDMAAQDLGDLLTSKGVKVEDVLWPWVGLEGVVVARVLEVKDHPNSDKLCLARISTGAAERDVVAGVRNMAPGDLVPYAGPGTRVPVLAEPLAERAIRGERSEGMLCSPRELLVSDLHEGILILDPTVEPGTDVKELFGLNDAVLDIEIEPNRPDLMSVIGVAREAAMATGIAMIEPHVQVDASTDRAEARADLEVLDLERCPRYVAGVLSGVSVGPSPVSVQSRLTASGMRPVSNVVDATNYVMLERGQPLHAFDLSKLEGPAIVVRRANDGETLSTLDEVQRSLTPDDLVIADRAKGVAIAGVMGSAVAEVSSTTTELLLESAHFAPYGIMRTARRLGLTTEASARFERGTDPEAVPDAGERAAGLIAAWAGGAVLEGVLERGGAGERRHVSMRAERATHVLGMTISTETAVRAFERLDIPVRVKNGSTTIEVPGYRIDLHLEEDLIEEVARVIGYEAVEARMPTIRQAGGVPSEYAFRDRVRDLLVRAGLHEVRLLSFASPADVSLAGDEEAVRIANPMSVEEGLLRTRLAPGLFHAASRNVARGVQRLAMFEIGTVFRLAGGTDPVAERTNTAFLLSGPADPGWHTQDRALDYFDAKGALEALFDGLGVTAWRIEGAAGPPLHPARSAALWIGADRVGEVGELHPRVARDFDLTGRVAVCEIDVGLVRTHAPKDLALRDVPRFPPVRRDLAFIVDDGVRQDAIREAILTAGGELLGTVTLFDVFAGGSIPEGRKSLAFALDFRSPERTLVDEDVDSAIASIVEHVRVALGAELRAG